MPQNDPVYHDDGGNYADLLHPEHTNPQKPPTTYTRVNDFGPHTDSILGGRGDLYTERLIHEYIIRFR